MSAFPLKSGDPDFADQRKGTDEGMKDAESMCVDSENTVNK